MRIDRIKKAGGLKDSFCGRAPEAVFEISMIVLIRLRMYYDRVIDLRLIRKSEKVVYGIGLPPGSRVRIWKPDQIVSEQMDVRLN
jgi:hypothetical protein